MRRIEAIRDYLKEEQMDAMLVTNLKNVFYLANFTGTAGLILLTQEKAFFMTDFRYRQQATEQAKGFEVIIREGTQTEALQGLIDQEGIERLMLEADDMKLSTYEDLEDALDVDFYSSRGVIEAIRAVKDPEEVERIRKACQITDEAYTHILDFIQVGMTELEVANELERFMKAKGASAMSFDTIVASGYRSAMPHGVASDKVIEAGDMVTIDFGCYYQGYSSDMTRTFAIGDVDPELEKIYAIVLEAHERVIAQAKAGMTGAEVDAIARDYISEQGYGEYFGHSTGHGLGIDVHEEPAIASRNEEPLEEYMVITDEPGIYIEGLGGVRIEDDLLVLADGVESLNTSPKHFIKL
ncbi:peptidase M24 family protein [Suicoccus acidiformans]|uniref:Peptidase M24 family protein n=1 Tax=Suicoccus acidiformans TaxID=2036206 RepID=A0A347WJC8_9LACT|nr:aminopeptidase P family protein [Suicoccus acidiformans]AXY25185.1 peptidase M24 family protein [Suicoccus acidiformans]